LTGVPHRIDLMVTTEARLEHPADDFAPPPPLARLTEERPRPADQDTATPWPTTQLNPRYSFDQFVIGASNRFAHAAALSVAESPAQAYNPLFIYGPARLGKTHLLHAIEHHVRTAFDDKRVRYVTTESSVNAFVEAIR